MHARVRLLACVSLCVRAPVCVCVCVRARATSSRCACEAYVTMSVCVADSVYVCVRLSLGVCAYV